MLVMVVLVKLVLIVNAYCVIVSAVNVNYYYQYDWSQYSCDYNQNHCYQFSGACRAWLSLTEWGKGWVILKNNN